jgi:RNA-directed DNA polymerase
VLDEHFAERWGSQSARAKRRYHGLANYRLVRYADDFVVMVSGTRAHAEDLREEVATVLEPMGLRLSEAKTRIAHIDEGFDFLGYRIQRQTKRGTTKRYVYTFPSKKALASIKAKVRALSRGNTNQPLAVLLQRLNPVLRGWTNYFRHGVSSATFDYLEHFTWVRVLRWLRHKHDRVSWKLLRRRYLPGWLPTDGPITMFRAGEVATVRYRYRGARIETPWTSTMKASTT